VTTIFVAREVITLDPACPTAEAIAARDGRILHVGSLAEVRDAVGSASHVVDDRFSDSVITPGFIEAHGHLFADGAVCAHVWLGFDDRRRPDGAVDAGCRSIEDVVTRLRAAVEEQGPNDGTISGYGFDPTFHDGRSLSRLELDDAGPATPVLVVNASGHLAYANGALMAARGIDRARIEPGVLVDEVGEPNGIFQETAMRLLFGPSDLLGLSPVIAVENGGRLAQLAGCTTTTDMAHFASGAAFDAFRDVAMRDGFPVRVVYAPHVNDMLGHFGADELLAHVQELRRHDTDRFRLGPLKWIADGSIQGYTGKLKWPGYCSGTDHGFLILSEDEVVEQMLPFHMAGFQSAIHTNGDEATHVVLNAIERILEIAPRPDHRHRLEHCQLASPAMFRRMAKMGVCANLFSNHIFYWGDTHRTLTVGPDKARRMDAAATALREGVAISLHSDAPVTPIGPLFTMWCAVNRLTRSGYLLGPHERITALQALTAMTLGSAYLLHLDHEVGSIEVGKLADLTVLEESPLSVEPTHIKDISVTGTVLGGVPTS
jgi:predicted amidohydrolase YtcJ